MNEVYKIFVELKYKKCKELEEFEKSVDKVFALLIKGIIDRRIKIIEKKKYNNISIEEKEEIYKMSEEIDKICKEMGWIK